MSDEEQERKRARRKARKARKRAREARAREAALKRLPSAADHVMMMATLPPEYRHYLWMTRP